MLSIGMVASFLTNNLTVGFILGMVFNAPLGNGGRRRLDCQKPALAQAVKQWSIVGQFRDFERGVISLSGISYFVMIAIIMLYISMVLIGRRHWGGREEKEADVGALSGSCTGLGRAGFRRQSVSFAPRFLDGHDQRTTQLASPKTIELVDKIRDDPKIRTIKIDAYVSPQVPAEYAAHKLNFLSTLSELSADSGGKIQSTCMKSRTSAKRPPTRKRRTESSLAKFIRLIAARARRMRFTWARRLLRASIAS